MAGVSWQRDNIHSAPLILACEDFVLRYRVKPHRPKGWNSDIDIFEDAKDRIIEACNDE